MELGQSQPVKPKKEQKGSYQAEAKFDALFGDPGPETKEDNSHLEAMIMESLAPPEATHKHNKNRKESSVGGGALRPQVARIKFDKKVLLARFKATREINLSVFEQQSLLDNCELIITSDEKPQSNDAFESLEEELEPSDATIKGRPGQAPENLRPTQEKPDHALQ